MTPRAWSGVIAGAMVAVMCVLAYSLKPASARDTVPGGPALTDKRPEQFRYKVTVYGEFQEWDAKAQDFKQVASYDYYAQKVELRTTSVKTIAIGQGSVTSVQEEDQVYAQLFDCISQLRGGFTYNEALGVGSDGPLRFVVTDQATGTVVLEAGGTNKSNQ